MTDVLDSDVIHQLKSMADSLKWAQQRAAALTADAHGFEQALKDVIVKTDELYRILRGDSPPPAPLRFTIDDGDVSPMEAEHDGNTDYCGTMHPDVSGTGDLSGPRTPA